MVSIQCGTLGGPPGKVGAVALRHWAQRYGGSSAAAAGTRQKVEVLEFIDIASGEVGLEGKKT